MTLSLNRFRKQLAILLIWQFSLVAGLPTGIHLTLCFAADGHFDLTTASCANGSVAIPHTEHDEHEPVKGKDCHGDCVDLELTCIALDKAQRASTAGSLKFKPHRNDSSVIPACCTASDFLTGQSYLNSSRHNYTDARSTTHLALLRPVILLI
jgi:hypothetical protein